jgi:exonuclease SbcC
LLRDLTVKANGYLGDLFDLPVSIEFTNETDEGGLAKITDIVKIGEVERAFALYSGGQSRRIQLAIDLALSDIVAARGDKPLNLLILDEVFKDLSENSMEKIVELLEKLNKKVILIEHNTVFKSIINNVIKIELRDGVSTCL